ncbi:energy-coupling factor transporter transmembrane component T family protein [Microbacterium foliorum]|uniref:energy-coupling factor transporter transmembrane component T family protein n=1 Tax=Microbacterium foliorum TaxID=104336 RepID=UPI001D5A91EC|nr:energy-coupling factor transporter transmembrane protein EcfT [Microbacterium foliorum]CAH0182142.1 Energy-coupling factor transporter transmembrane protein BioN [Microbacterium foliorum]CAH0213172.1 Energy-coupling factor transporter transmembrane protein BioN [Microbacterium foliorum]
MIQAYRHGTSVVHRMPAGAKLTVLAALALTLSTVPHGVMSITLALLAVGGLYLLARLPMRILGTEIWRLRWLVLVLGMALWFFVSPLTAWVNTGRVVTLLLSASLLTITTPMEQLVAVLHRLLLPLRRYGVNPDAVAMTMSLALTMIPVVASFATDVRDAHRARGIRVDARGVVPLMVRTLRHADDVGDALAARGLT